jgi:hypothetical protein
MPHLTPVLGCVCSKTVLRSGDTLSEADHARLLGTLKRSGTSVTTKAGRFRPAPTRCGRSSRPIRQSGWRRRRSVS